MCLRGAKLEKILQAAQKLFGQFGLKKVTIEDIAKEASVSKVTLYKYFRNKDDIFEEVVRFEGDQMFRAIEAAVARETDTAGKFKAHLMVYGHHFRKVAETV